MIAVALALLVQQPAPAPAQVPAQAPAPAASGSTTVSPLTVTPAPEAAPDPQQIAADLAELYDRSCNDRIFGMYAQACNELSERLHVAQAAARKAAKLKASAKPAVAAAK